MKRKANEAERDIYGERNKEFKRGKGHEDGDEDGQMSRATALKSEIL